MCTKKFNAKDLENALWSCKSPLKIIEDNIVEVDDWEIVHNVIFEDLETNLYYFTDYSKGATEEQESEWFGEGMIECPRVIQKPVIKMVWQLFEEPHKR